MVDKNTEDLIQPLDNDSVVMMPPLEQDVALPKNAREALPDLSNEEELEVMANTIKLVSDIMGQEIKPTQEDIDEAKHVAKTMISNPKEKIQLKKYKNSTLASLAGMVAEMDTHVVDELKDLKAVVVNGLLKEAFTADKSKERITALRAIGEVDGVDAFKKHTEVVHTNMPLAEVEQKLAALVAKVQKRMELEETKEVKGEIIENGE
jgi:hypothetical protein